MKSEFGGKENHVSNSNCDNYVEKKFKTLHNSEIGVIFMDYK